MAKQFTGIEGFNLPVVDTIEAFNKIADGEYDHVAEQAFFMCGGLDDVEQKWAEIPEEPLMAELSADKVLQVELVAADRLVWSGQATMVIARTTEGDVGILPYYAPLLSSIIEGVVDVQTVEGETWVAAVDAGFMSVADNRVDPVRAGRDVARDRPGEGASGARAGQELGRERRRRTRGRTPRRGTHPCRGAGFLMGPPARPLG